MTHKRHINPPIRDAIQVEQFRILKQQVPILYAVLSVNTAILSASVNGQVSAELAFGVPSIVGVLIAIRLAVWSKRQEAQFDVERISAHLWSTTVLSAAISLLLGIWGVMLLVSGVGDKPFVQLFVAFGSIACAYSLSCLPSAACATILFGTIPVTTALLLSADVMKRAEGLNLLLIFGITIRLIFKQYQSLIDIVTSHAQLRSLAYSDPLTGLPNRRAFIEALDEQRNSYGPEESLFVAMIDLDGFKALNDTFGHAVGDSVLIEAASRIQATCTGCQLVARLGGDEFAVLLAAEIGSLEMDDLAEGIITSIAEMFDASGSRVGLGVSIGIASGIKSRKTSASTLMSRADVALYEVKRAGGNAAINFSESMEAHYRRRVDIEQALRADYPAPEIDVVYQPIFDARTQKVCAYEALARWTHPQLGSISPMEFIAVAERAGLICKISNQIFSKAIEEAARWPHSIGLSINLSATQLVQASTPLSIISLCNQFKLDPTRLEVEMTETAMLADYGSASEQLGMLRSVGMKVSLDDFGSGYASISYLRAIKFDRVKIDGDLVRDIAISQDAANLLYGIIQLCKSLDLPVTAEKVENESQAAILVEYGCDRLQGYYLGRPVASPSQGGLTSVLTQAA